MNEDQARRAAKRFKQISQKIKRGTGIHEMTYSSMAETMLVILKSAIRKANREAAINGEDKFQLYYSGEGNILTIEYGDSSDVLLPPFGDKHGLYHISKQFGIPEKVLENPEFIDELFKAVKTRLTNEE
jgi:hypothetical protein